MPSGTEFRGVKPQMVLDKRRDEVVAVIVAVVGAKLERQSTRRARSLEQFRFQLLDEPLIAAALIDENFRIMSCVGCIPGNLTGVIVVPGGRVVA